MVLIKFRFMVKRYIFLLVCALMAVSGYGQNFGESNIVYSYYGYDWHSVPGVERINDIHHNGSNDRSDFNFPEEQNDIKCCYNGKQTVYMTESTFTEEFIDITSKSFIAKNTVIHPDRNGRPDRPKDLHVTYNLEWTTINKMSKWNNAVYYECANQPVDAEIKKGNDLYIY